MKKLFFLFVFVIMLAGMSVSAFSQTERDAITVDGFDGDKSLGENQTVIVNYGKKMEGIFEDAYKGETRKTFLERINKRSQDSQEMGVKKEHLSFQEFSDSIILSAEGNNKIEAKISLTKTSDGKIDQSLTQTKAQVIIGFFFFLVLVFLFLNRISVFWKKDNPSDDTEE